MWVLILSGGSYSMFGHWSGRRLEDSTPNDYCHAGSRRL